MIWEGFHFNSPELEIHTTTFQEKYECFEQSSLVLPSKLEQDAEELI